MKRNVVVISLSDTLEAVGLRTLLQDTQGVHAIVVPPDVIERQGLNVEADYLITDSCTFISQIDFFLPRRKNVIIMGDSSASGGLQTIDSHLDESELIDSLNRIMAKERPERDMARSELSLRETDVLRLVVSGKINKEIAAELGISVNTVLTHRKNITSKLGIKSVSGLSFYALMNNLV